MQYATLTIANKIIIIILTIFVIKYIVNLINIIIHLRYPFTLYFIYLIDLIKRTLL